MNAFTLIDKPIITGTVLNDEQLVLLCQASDARGQEALYQKFANKMYRICLRYLNNEMESEDAMIEGFVKVFSKVATFEYRGKGSFEGWIKRIMINESLMILRRRKQIKVDIDQVFDLESEDSSDAVLLEADVIHLINKLPKGYKTVFSLYVIDGYSHKEIGEKLGISENTSKSQLSKARASLAGSLTKLGAI